MKDETNCGIGTVLVSSLIGAAIAIAVMFYFKQEDVGRMEEMEREMRDFRQETSVNFDSIRAEILANRAKIDTVKANTDTLKAGQAVIYNAVMSFDKERPESGTPYEFLKKVGRMFGIGE